MLANNESETTSISMEAPLLARGRAKAKARRQTFSAYLATLIERDLRKEQQANAQSTRPQPATPAPEVAS